MDLMEMAATIFQVVVMNFSKILLKVKKKKKESSTFATDLEIFVTNEIKSFYI